jgi:hypothetical protein
MKAKSERFWEKVDKNGPVPPHRPALGKCWVWIGSIATDGYGKLKSKIGSKLVNERAHRVSWELDSGKKIPERKLICHHCDNILCVRPSHLFIGDDRDNVRDMIEKRRNNWGIVRKLTPEQVQEIRNTNPSWGYQTRLAEKFGVHQSVVSDVANYKSFKI